MGRRIMRLSPEAMVQYLTDGTASVVNAGEGLPRGTRFLKSRWDEWERNYVLLLESEAWDGPDEGEAVPFVDVTVRALLEIMPDMRAQAPRIWRLA